MAKNNKKDIGFDSQEFFEVLTRILSSYKSTSRIDLNTFTSLNANFIYSLALFDRFLGELILYLIKNDKKVRKQYLGIFEGVIREKIHKNENSEWFNYRTSKQMIDNYPELEKLKSQIVLAKTLLNIDLKDKLNDKVWKCYLEARERRNLLTHRGRKPDDIYYKELKYNKVSSDFLLKIFKNGGLYRHSTSRNPDEMEYDERTGRYRSPVNVPNSPVDLSVTKRYLESTIYDLFYLSFTFLLGAKNKDIDIDVTTPLHTLLVHCSTNKSLQLYTLIPAIFLKLIESSSSMNKLSIQDKVNLILFNEMGKDHKHFKKRPPLLKPSGVLTLIDSIKDDEHREAKIMKKLLRNYVDKDKNKFLKNTKKFIKAHEENLAAYNSWLIFKKYLRYKEFKELRYKRS